MFLRSDAPGHAPALFDSPGWINYADLNGSVAARAQKLGPRKKLIFLFATSSADCIVDLLAALQGGHAVALLDPSLPASQARPLLGSYLPDLVVGSDCPTLQLAAQYASAREVPDYAKGRRAIAIGTSSRTDLHPDLALLLSTSGSTGSPKFVRLSARNIEANARSIADVLAISANDRVFAHLPLHYSFGFSVVSSHLCAGASIVPTSASIASAEAWRLFREQACTTLPGVPSHFDVLRRLDIDRLNVPSLSCLLQAGGRMAPPLVEHFARKMAARGGRLFVMYGQTEAGPRMTTLPADRIFDAIGSVGPALPGGRIEIRDDKGRTLFPGQSGEVVYFGPNVMMGYALSRADLGRGPDLEDGLHTGDVGVLDERGFLTLIGRASRYTKVHGVRISLDEVEKLAGLDRPVAAIARDDDRILVLVEGAGDAGLGSLRDALADALRLSPTSVLVRSIASIPTRPNGKTDYLKLSEVA